MEADISYIVKGGRHKELRKYFEDAKSAGIPISFTSQSEGSLLHVAAKVFDVNMCQILLDFGADINYKVGEYTPVEYVIMSSEKHPDEENSKLIRRTVGWFLSRGAKTGNLLTCAVSQDNLKLVEYLLLRGADPIDVDPVWLARSRVEYHYLFIEHGANFTDIVHRGTCLPLKDASPTPFEVALTNPLLQYNICRRFYCRSMLPNLLSDATFCLKSVVLCVKETPMPLGKCRELLQLKVALVLQSGIIFCMNAEKRLEILDFLFQRSGISRACLTSETALMDFVPWDVQIVDHTWDNFVRETSSLKHLARQVIRRQLLVKPCEFNEIQNGLIELVSKAKPSFLTSKEVACVLGLWYQPFEVMYIERLIRKHEYQEVRQSLQEALSRRLTIDFCSYPRTLQGRILDFNRPIGSMLCFAAICSDAKMCEILLEFGADKNGLPGSRTPVEVILTNVSDPSEMYPKAKWFIDKGVTGVKALEFAAMRRDLGLFEYLLQHGADPNSLNPFSVFLEDIHEECLSLLFKYGLDVPRCISVYGHRLFLDLLFLVPFTICRRFFFRSMLPLFNVYAHIHLDRLIQKCPLFRNVVLFIQCGVMLEGNATAMLKCLFYYGKEHPDTFGKILSSGASLIDYAPWEMNVGEEDEAFIVDHCLNEVFSLQHLARRIVRKQLFRKKSEFSDMQAGLLNPGPQYGLTGLPPRIVASILGLWYI